MSKVFVVSGPSGVGKGTLCKKLLEEHPELGLHLSVSMTTRAPRPGEINGQHYHFVSSDQFKAAIEQNQMLEWATYNSQFYGTPKSSVCELLNTDKPVLLEIEPQGAFQVKKLFPKEAILIFILPPSLQVLVERLKNRGTNTPADIDRRLTIAQQELAQKDQFDCQLVNDDLSTAVKNFAKLIEKCLNKKTKN